MTQKISSSFDYEVIVVGSGFSGSVIGLKAAELGLNVRVFDGRPEYLDQFRAEKLETDQHEALERLGLIDFVRPTNYSYIDRVHELVGQKEKLVPCSKHRGINYQDTVNAFRSSLMNKGLLEIRKVSQLHDTDDYCEIKFDDGAVVRARLAVIATGGTHIVRKSLHLGRHQLNAMLSTTFGFYVEPTSPDGFQFGAFNLKSERNIAGFHYATFFPVGNQTRVNVFTCWHPGTAEAKEFRSNPLAELHGLFPHLSGRIGSFRLTSALQVFTTHYYRHDCSHLKSAVLVGDEFQSVSPATGMGLSKCLTDSLALLQVTPHLLGRKNGRLDLQLFYDNNEKRRVDDAARHKWEWANETATSRSLKTKLKKLKRRLVSFLKRTGVPAAADRKPHNS
jgi:2-polyprenyl-6-methoxyphenol hydroxylase-like FAD-dependent oxidoreductase